MFFNKTWIFIFNSVFLNYSTPIKADTEELKVVENLEKFLFGIILKYIHTHACTHKQLLGK